MNDPVAVLDLFVRGLAAGAMAAWSLGIVRSGVSRQARIVTLALGVSVICWLITESATLRAALGDLNILVALAYPLGGLFWLFVLTVFEDAPLTWPALTPSIVLVVLGFVMNAPATGSDGPVWIVFNGFSGLLAVHAGFLVARGWRDDLIEGRRRARAVLLGLVSLFVIGQVAAAFLARLDPTGPWHAFTISGAFGGAVLAALTLAGAVLFLQARPALFGGTRRIEMGADPRAEAVDRLLLDKLEAFVAGEGWRREGLSIGDLARELEVPEHRLRRLINQRLGHRNFADFLNASRVEAAKRRLADPGEARTTVAAIAFDLGYGSLGPFNRAFRTATGATPTEWRRQALQASPNLEEAV
ncbi:helix-turn-helix domain-containing protein [Phenylobacterium sp.]|uniref:helix-turn-helix domain-containing protein n=1 Tax=Phenylobacterium sp. TaxID=1871053 RepID=UPI0035662683